MKIIPDLQPENNFNNFSLQKDCVHSQKKRVLVNFNYFLAIFGAIFEYTGIRILHNKYSLNKK